MRPALRVLGCCLVLAWFSAGCARAFSFFSERDKAEIRGEKQARNNKDAAGRARRLQQEVMDFSDRYTMGMWQAVDEYLRGETDPQKRVAGETWKVLFSSASMEIAAGRDPAGDLLDMYVFVKLGASVTRKYWVPEVFGPRADTLNKEYVRLLQEISSVVAEYLPSGQRAELVAMIAGWQAAHPGAVYIADTRLRDLVELRSRGGAKQGGGVPLLSEVQRAVGEVDEALHYGERMMFYLERLPRLTTMQTALALAQAGAAPSIVSLAKSAETASQAVATLPQALTASVAENAETIGTLLPGVQSTLGEARALSESLVRLSAPREGSRPWPPQDINASLAAAQSATRELGETIAGARRLLETASAPQSAATVGQLLRDVRAGGRDVVDHAYIRALQFVLFFLAGQALVVWVAVRLWHRKPDA